MRSRSSYLVLADHLGLFELLHGKEIARRDEAHEAHLAERATANDLDRLEGLARESHTAQSHVLGLLLVQSLAIALLLLLDESALGHLKLELATAKTGTQHKHIDGDEPRASERASEGDGTQYRSDR